MENQSVSELTRKYRAFREWQQQPHQVAPLSNEEHDCSTCGTHFQGNYCPRCGQSASIARYSFKKAFLLFLDVWGLGNRGMFRTLRDLLLRPGYMIRDYLSGMQMAYFPPFKMFFLLITLSLLVDTGLNIQGVNRIKQNQEMFEEGLEESEAEQKQKQKETTTIKETPKENLSEKEQAKMQKAEELEKKINHGSTEMAKKAFDWVYKHLTIFMLVSLLLISGPLYLMFRHSPAIPDMHYSEFFVTMVYITNMLNILSIVCSLLCLDPLFEIFIYPLAIIPIKQLSGYSYWSTILRVLVATIAFIIIAFILIFAIGVIASIIYFKIN